MADIKTDFSMGQLDFERYHELLKWADKLAIDVRRGNFSTIYNYYATLRQIFINWKPLIKKEKKVKFEENFKTLKNHMNRLLKEMNDLEKQPIKKGVRIPPDVFDLLDSLHEDLLEVKQRVGLGVPLRYERSEKEKVRHDLGTKKRKAVG